AFGEQGEAEAHGQGILPSVMALDARESAEDESAAEGGDASAKVAVYPITESGEADDGEQSADEGPQRGEPGLEHPAEGGAHEGGAEDYAAEGVVEKDLSEGEEQALGRVVDRGVGRFLVDVEAFEVDPHGVSGVGEASVGEGVGHEQVAEFVVDAGDGDGFDGEDGEPEGEGGEADDDD